MLGWLTTLVTLAVVWTWTTATGVLNDAAFAVAGAATSTPAIAMAGAALVAFSATFSTCDGVVCLPVRRILRGRRCVLVVLTELPMSVLCSPTGPVAGPFSEPSVVTVRDLVAFSHYATFCAICGIMAGPWLPPQANRSFFVTHPGSGCGAGGWA